MLCHGSIVKAGHVLVIHIESRVICSKCETVYGQKNDHCKVISAEEQVAIIASLTTVVSATLHGLPLYLMANGGTDTNKSVESVKYKDSIDGKMIFFNYFFDSVHPRSLGCSSPQGNPRKTATGSVATLRLSNWLYGNGFTETKNAYAGKVVHSPIFGYVRDMEYIYECSNDLLLPDSRERLMTLMSSSIKGAKMRRDNGTDVIGGLKGAQAKRDNGTDVIAALKGAQTRRENGTDIIAALKGAKTRRDNGTDVIAALKGAQAKRENGTDIIGIMKSSETKAKKRYDSLKGLCNNPDPAALIDELFLVYAEKRLLYFKAEPGFKTRKLYIG
jgi:hypothetical protein